MLSKSLFKQSCKANGTMWLIITIAVCFMLSCVMLISGNGQLGETKQAIQSTIIEGELTSGMQERAINYYEIANNALCRFDKVFAENAENVVKTDAFMQVYMTGGEAAAKQYAAGVSYKAAAEDLQKYAAAIADEKGYAADSDEAKEIQGVIFYTLNVMTTDENNNTVYSFDDFYKEHGEEAPRYDLSSIGSALHNDYREKYVMKNVSAFLAGNMVGDENIENMLSQLSDYGVTREQYADFGFADYENVKSIANGAIVDYRANLEYRLDNMKDGETEESIKEELVNEISGSLLSTLPQEVSDALEEIGAADLYGTLIGSIFFKMAGLLLPIIYMIMTANALIAGQVDSGSMAYILSSSVKRRSVTFTQAIYLISSLFVMFLCTTVTSLICFNIVDVDTSLNTEKLLIINLGAFLVMFAMSGICFAASCWFNRSKNSMALGGGLNMFFLVATMLGLFGSSVLPSIIRMDALNYFNYASIISFFDVVSILEGTNAYIWKFGVLIVIGIIGYVAGSVKFRKKDLPL